MSAAASPSRPSGPVRLRRSLVGLGPVFIKLGQYLALRPDILPQEYCDELLGLVDQVPPFPWPEARQILREDLGEDFETRFTHFPRRPVAAGSLAQVYVARVPGGEAVAVKVQRAGLEARVEKDLRRLHRLLRLTGTRLAVPADQLHDELSRWLHEELDMERELGNVERMSELFGEHPRFRIPCPFPELSGRRVLTTEYFEGVPLSEILRLARSGEPEKISAMGYETDRLAENLLVAVMDQVFRHNLFHADTHPGNLVALPDHRIGFVDFGLVERLDPAVRSGLTRYVAAVYSGDADRIFQGLQEVLLTTETTDLNMFRNDLRDAVRAWVSGGPADRGSRIGRFMVEAMQAARRNGLDIPPATLSMYRSLLTAETVAHQLGAGTDLGTVGRGFFVYLQVHDTLQALYPEQVRTTLVDLVALLRDLPGDLRQILASLAEERLPFRLRTEASRRDRRLDADKARLVSASTVSVGIAVLLAGFGDVHLFGPLDLSTVFWIVLAALYLRILVLWRRLP